MDINQTDFFENFLMKNNNPLPFCETEQKLIKCQRDNNHYHFGYISLFLSSIENKAGNAITFEEYTNLLDCLNILINVIGNKFTTNEI